MKVKVNQAFKVECPKRFHLPPEERGCIGSRCMAWRFSEAPKTVYCQHRDVDVETVEEGERLAETWDPPRSLEGGFALVRKGFNADDWQLYAVYRRDFDGKVTGYCGLAGKPQH